MGFALKNDLAKFRRRLAPTLAASPCLDLQPRLAARLASGSSGNGAKRPRVAASPPGLRACVGLELGLALDKAEQVSQSRWVNAGAKTNQLALVGVWALASARVPFSSRAAIRSLCPVITYCVLCPFVSLPDGKVFELGGAAAEPSAADLRCRRRRCAAPPPGPP